MDPSEVVPSSLFLVQVEAPPLGSFLFRPSWPPPTVDNFNLYIGPPGVDSSYLPHYTRKAMVGTSLEMLLTR